MEYKVLSPRYFYFLSLLVIMTGLSFLTFLINEAAESQEWIALAILIICASILLLWLKFYLNKFIYAKIDITNQVFIFGNLFFDQKIDIDKVELIGNTFFSRRMIKLRIGEKIYFANSIDDDGKGLLKQS